MVSVKKQFSLSIVTVLSSNFAAQHVNVFIYLGNMLLLNFQHETQQQFWVFLVSISECLFSFSCHDFYTAYPRETSCLLLFHSVQVFPLYVPCHLNGLEDLHWIGDSTTYRPVLCCGTWWVCVQFSDCSLVPCLGCFLSNFLRKVGFVHVWMMYLLIKLARHLHGHLVV